MQRGVGVLLRLDHPEDEVGEGDDALGLEPVRRLDRVEVRQVEQDEPVEPVLVDAVAAPDLEPVEERVGAVAPDRRLPGRRRRPPPADRGQLGPGEDVEELRLADAGRPGERDDGRLEAEPEPRAGLRDDGACRVDVGVVEPALGQLGGLPERGEAVVELRRSRGAADRVDGRVQPREGVGLGRRLVEHGVEARRLLARSRSTRSTRSSRARAASVRTAWSPKIASSTFWPTADVPPATTTSPPVRPPVCAKTASITVRPAPLTPSEASRAVVRFDAPSSRTRSKTTPCQARTSSSAAASRPGDARSSSGRVGEQRPARNPLAPGARRPLGGALGGVRTTASTRCSTATFSSASAAGEPVTMLFSRSRSRPTRVSSARITSPVPTTSCQRASTSPRRSEPLRSAPRPRAAPPRRPRRPRRAARPPRELLHRRALDDERPHREARERAAERPPNERAAAPGRRRRARRASRARARAPRPAGAPLERDLGTTSTSASPSRSARASAAGARAPRRPASAGTRLSTIESAVPRSRAERRNSHGTASA